MTKQILVPLKRSAQLESFLPYIEEIAQPGMRVVLALRSKADGLKDFTEHLLAIDAGIRADVATWRQRARTSLEKQRRAERKLLPLCNRLAKQGVHITVNVYAGSLRRVIRRAMETEDVHLVMMRSPMEQVKYYLRRIIPFASWSEAVSFPPVILFHSGK